MMSFYSLETHKIMTVPVPIHASVRVRPDAVGVLFDEIAEPVPLELTFGDGTAQLHFTVADIDNFPIAVARSFGDIDLFTDSKGVGGENRYIGILFHGWLLDSWFPYFWIGNTGKCPSF
jgi:hypothetical protein